MSLEIYPCRKVNPASVEITDAEHAEFWGLFRRLQDFPTREAAMDAMHREFRFQAYEAQGVPRADAQVRVDAEHRDPALRNAAHGLPQYLADAGYRIEFGDENAGKLRGKWWWTISENGQVESSELEWDSPADVIADIQRERDQRLKHLLREAVAYEAEDFDADRAISGSDLVDWFREFRKRAKQALNTGA
jgi:hypothetical protein